MRTVLIFCLCLFLFANDFCQNVIETNYGKIQGQILNTIQEPHSQYLAFRGIPYARPPLGELRFQPPKKLDPWNNTKLCDNYGNKCLQISKTDGSVIGNEDCLTLNIFTKDIDLENLKPVMFWIHGGAHLRGSGSEYGPDYLMEKPVILITINYRLNIFGYFTTNDENAYGNTAIKDQIAALEWVKDNIAKFGGDATKVTIFGCSSGSDSVSLLQLSSRARGLFHQVISQSGSSLNPRYLQRNPLQYTYKIAKYFNISTETTRDIVEGLQKVDSEILAKAANSSEVTGYKTNLRASAFYPVIEVENNEAVLTQSPYQLLQNGNFNKVPFIVGYNSEEGSLGLGIAEKEMNVKDFDVDERLFYIESLNNANKSKEIGRVVRNFFLGNDSAKNTEKFLNFLGQELLVRGIRKGIDFLTQYSDGYFYKFLYKGTHTIQYAGVGHGEELQYIFVRNGTTENLTKNDILTRKRMVEMWTNFVIYGAPTPKREVLGKNISWEKCDQTVTYLEIDEKLELKSNPDEDEYNFWKKLFEEYGNPPYLTY